MMTTKDRRTWLVPLAFALMGAGFFGGGVAIHTHVDTNNGGTLPQSAINLAGGIVIARDVAPQDVCNSNSTTTVSTLAIPANTLSSNKMLRVTVLGDYLNNSGASQQTGQVSVSYGGTQIGQTANTALVGASATRFSWQLLLNMAAANATNSQVSFGKADEGSAQQGGVFSTSAQNLPSSNNAIAVDSTVSQNLVVTITNAAAATTICTRKLGVFVELL